MGGKVESRPSAASAAWAGLTASAAGEAAPEGTTCGEEGTSVATGRPSSTPVRAWAGTRLPGPVSGTADTASGLAGAGTIGREPTGPPPWLPGASCSTTAPVPPAGFPRVLTVPLPCASSRALTFREAVSRETAADSARLTRAGGPSGSRSRKTRPCPSSPALPTFRATPAVSCPDPATTGLVPGTGRPIGEGRYTRAARFLTYGAANPAQSPPFSTRPWRRRANGWQAPPAIPRRLAKPSARSSQGSSAPFSSRYRCAGPLPCREQARCWSWRRARSGPRASRPVPVWPPNPATVIGARSAGPLLQPDRPYRSPRREPPRPAYPIGRAPLSRRGPPPRPSLP